MLNLRRSKALALQPPKSSDSLERHPGSTKADTLTSVDPFNLSPAWSEALFEAAITRAASTLRMPPWRPRASQDSRVLACGSRVVTSVHCRTGERQTAFED